MGSKLQITVRRDVKDEITNNQTRKRKPFKYRPWLGTAVGVALSIVADNMGLGIASSSHLS